MRRAVKINHFSLARMGQIAWLAYFAFTLVIIGFILAYGVVVPLALLGRIFRPCKKGADFVMVKGIGLLMSVQPWLKARVEITTISDAGALLVSNHRSHLDAFFLLSRVRGVKILAKRSLFNFPGIGPIMWVSRQIPVSENGMASYLDAMEEVRERLKKAETVHIFPEMTRCQAGYRGPLNFSRVPFRVAFQEGIPVFPIIFKDTDSVWPKGQVGLNFRKPVEMKMLAPVYPRDFEDYTSLKIDVQKRIEQGLS